MSYESCLKASEHNKQTSIYSLQLKLLLVHFS